MVNINKINTIPIYIYLYVLDSLLIYEIGFS